LFVRYDVYTAASRWELAAEIAQAICRIAPTNPIGFVRLAFCLHEMRRTKEAWNVLLPLASRFPGEYLIAYNLACYACQLGNGEDAQQWLKKAFALAGAREVKRMALEDPDLEPLRTYIADLKT